MVETSLFSWTEQVVLYAMPNGHTCSTSTDLCCPSIRFENKPHVRVCWKYGSASGKEEILHVLINNCTTFHIVNWFCSGTSTFFNYDVLLILPEIGLWWSSCVKFVPSYKIFIHIDRYVHWWSIPLRHPSIGKSNRKLTSSSVDQKSRGAWFTIDEAILRVLVNSPSFFGSLADS